MNTLFPLLSPPSPFFFFLCQKVGGHVPPGPPASAAPDLSNYFPFTQSGYMPREASPITISFLFVRYHQIFVSQQIGYVACKSLPVVKRPLRCAYSLIICHLQSARRNLLQPIALLMYKDGCHKNIKFCFHLITTDCHHCSMITSCCFSNEFCAHTSLY